MSKNSMQNCGDDERQRVGLREVPLRFIGKVLALFGHELNNQLATLRETVGLAEDITGAKHLSEKDKMKEIARLLDSLNSRVDRTVYLSRNLTNFSQRVGFPSQGCDINAAIDELLTLAGKGAKQKNIVLKKEFAEGIPTLEADTFMVELLLYCLIDNLITQLDPGGVITIATSGTPHAAGIRLIPGQLKASSEDKIPWSAEVLDPVLQEIKADMHFEEGTGNITITIPIRRSISRPNEAREEMI